MKRALLLLSAYIFLTLSSNAQMTAGLIAHWPFNGTAQDSSGNGHNGTQNNILYGAGRNGKANSAAIFNGTSSIITVPPQSDLNVDSYSICTIVKLNGFYSGLCEGNYLVARGDVAAAGGYGLNVMDNAYNSCGVLDTSHETFTVMGSMFPPSSSQQYSPNVISNTWYCIVAVFNGTVAKVYVNGILKNTNTGTGGSIGSSTLPLTIGAWGTKLTTGYPYWVKGAIDDIRLYSRSLTVTEIDSYCNYYNTISTEHVDIVGGLNFLQIYPNPGKGDITISGTTDNNKTVQIEISNTLGQVIYRDNVTPRNNELNKRVSLGTVSSGMYFVRLFTDRDSKTHRLIIE